MKLKITLFALLALSGTLAFGQNYLMNAALTSVTDCSGFFLDSGGGNNSYGANQNFTTTICPDNTTGTHVQLVFSTTDLAPGDELCFFDGPNAAAPSLSCASDFASGAAFIIQATAANPGGCITVTFNSDATGQAAGWSADMNCIPACQTIVAELDHSDPAAVPADTGWIDICPGERVFFYGNGSYPQNGVVYNHSDLTSNFEWDFGDGVITYGPTVSHIFEEPGGYVVQLEIKDQFGCTNTNFISQRVRVAPKPDFSTGDWPDQICAGDTVHLNSMIDSLDMAHTVSVLSAEAGFQTLGVRSDSLPLPDGDGSCYTTSISFTDFSPGQVLTNISDLLGIYVTMEHSWLRDLEITLTCPNGQSAILHNHPGQTGGEVFLGIPYEADEGFVTPIPGTGYDYGWSTTPDYNYTWIQYSNAFSPNTLPQGTYNSYQPLTNFLGCPLNGDWEIEVCDLWAIDNGYIFSWSIEFNPDLYPDIETFSPQIVSWEWNNHPSIYFNSNDSISGSPVNAGEVAYTFTVHDEFGCAWDTTVDIQVLPFTHPLCHSCEDILTPAPDTTICSGEQVGIDVSSPVMANQSVTFESYDDYPLGASNHPPANPYSSIIQVNSINPATITNVMQDIVSVCLDFQTDFDADIQIFLRSPNNQLLMLSTNNGGSGDNYTQTCFSPTAVAPITSGTAPFTGTFQSEGSWAVLNGTPINGNWALRISDAFGLNAMGKLNWWSITFRSQNNVTYTWTPPTGLSCTNCPNPTATPANNTSYIVTAVDSYGCVTKDTMGITVLSSFTAPAVILQQIGNGQIVANWNDVSPGLPYEVNVNGTGWVPSNNGNLSHLISGLVNGDAITVEVRVDVGAACQVGIGNASLMYQFCPIDAFPTNPGPYAVSCNNDCDEAVQISVTGGQLPYTFGIFNQTTGAMSSQNNGNLVNLCPGNYVIAVADAVGCPDTVTFSVANPPPLVASVVQDSPVTCNGGSDGCATANAFGGAGGYTYVWGNPNMSTQQSICGLPAGVIIVTVTDQNGCDATGAINIIQPPVINLAFTKTDVKCTGGNDGIATVTASGGVGTFTYQWSAGTTPTQNSTGGLTAGTVSVTVTDANGCQAFGNVAINQPATNVQVTANQTLVSCYSENNSEATATASGGSGAYTYLWTPSNQVTPTAIDLPIGSYTVVVTDAAGCIGIGQVDLVQWPAFDLLISVVPPTCNGLANGEMNVVVLAGGDGNYTFDWSNSANTDYITGLQGGQTYTVTVTDGQGCTGTKSRTLDNPPAMQLTITPDDANCNGSADGVATVTNVGNGQSPFSYQWSAAALNQTTAVADSLVAGNYSVVVTDVNGCSGTGQVTIGEPQPIVATFKIENNECFGYENGVAEVTVSGGVPAFSYLWSNNATSAKITDLPADSYYLTITDANGCTALDSVFIAAPERVDAIVTVKDVSCFGDRNGSITIEPVGGTQPFTYSLDGSQYYGSSTLIALEAGDYQVYLKDAEGCVYETSATVNEPPQMTVSILVWGDDVDEFMLDYGGTFPLLAVVENGQGSIMYTWDASYCGTLFQDTTSDCTMTLTSNALWSIPDYTNDYFVVAIDSSGCEAEDHLQVHVKKERRVVVPTGFTPNSNGTNDLLSIHGKSGTMVKRFQVFDRWGELLFEDIDIPINDTTRGWDGTFKSKDMPPGVYVWYLDALYEDGMTESFKGETTLIR
ncbi:MAG: proprotein convertase P-domain-containing protein [Bacteroidetes bacterium]|nr:proprotein convertase P-domain-containing protein [Bacteroidota bacterium]